MWKENAMQYFFRKILGLNFSATKLFLKNRLRLDIVGAFSWQQTFTFFFFIFSWCLIFDWGAIKAVGRNGKDSGMATGILGLAAYCCARWRKCIDGREKRSFRIRKVNAGYRLEELGKAMAKRGKHFAEKWWGSTGSPTENLYLDNCLKKRLQRQWYGILKENALLGNFQRAPQTHYKS